MLVYLYNHKVDKIKKDSRKSEITMMRYCDHCNSTLVGHWEYVNKYVKYKKEIDYFFSMDTCPICNSNFERDENKHVFFANEFVVSYSYKKLYEDLCNRFPKNKFEFHKSYTVVDPSEINVKIGDQQKNSTFAYEQKLVIKYETRNGGTILTHFDTKSVDSKLSYFKHFSESKLDDLANSLIETTIEKYNIKPVEKSLSKSTFGLESLKNYLNHICQLETNIFVLSERLKFLYRIHLESEKEAEASLHLLTFELKRQLKESQNIYTELEKTTPEKKISLKEFAFDYPKKPTAPTPPKKPTLKTPGLFNKKKINAENNLLTEEYQAKLVAYNEEFKQYSEELGRYNAKVEELEQKQNEMYSAKIAEVCKEKQDKLDSLNNEIKCLEGKIDEIESNDSDIVTKEKIKNELVESEIKEAEKTLSETYNALNELYSYGVIFGKYRNFVAVSTFYEYLASGRCTTLEGADGAYNIYESEIRANQVISQLSQVIASLEQIQQNQFVVYSAIQESNRNLAQLKSSMNSAVSSLNDIKTTTNNMSNTMKKIAENTAVSAYNSSVTAFYSKKNAELTNALGYMVAFS